MERKIKVLRIITRLNIGGPSIHTILLTYGMNRDLFDCLLVTGILGKDEGDMSYYARERKVVPKVIPELQRKPDLVKDIAAVLKIYRLLLLHRPDILHTHTAKAGALGRIAGAWFNLLHPFHKIKLVHTFHGHVFEGYFSKIKSSAFVFIEKTLAKLSDKIITVSESAKDELVSLGISRDIGVIPLGLDLKKYLDIPERKDGQVLNVGIVGRLVPIKNHVLFLDSVSKLLNTLKPEKEIKIKIIGGGELTTFLKSYSRKLGIDRYVDFLGWQNELVKVYNDLDIVALTSLNEGTPVSLIEAMASARPIVATDVGGVRDLLGRRMGREDPGGYPFEILERGILVSGNNPDSFAQALLFLIQNPVIRNKMGQEGRLYSSQKFSQDRLIMNMESLYLSLLNNIG